MVFSFLAIFLHIAVTSAYMFDATPTQRADALQNLGAPITNISVPELTNIMRLHPNATLTLPNDTGSKIESLGMYDYSVALTLPWKYLRAERLGKLPTSNGIAWRADAFVDDPVLGGYADAGDFLVCVMPLSQSLTLISLSLKEFGEGYAAASATSDALDALRWGLDFLVRCRTSDIETVIQIGKPDIDHSIWLPAEQADKSEGPRPAYKVSPSVPGSDVQAAMAGALAVGKIQGARRGGIAPIFTRRVLWLE